MRRPCFYHNLENCGSPECKKLRQKIDSPFVRIKRMQEILREMLLVVDDEAVLKRIRKELE